MVNDVDVIQFAELPLLQANQVLTTLLGAPASRGLVVTEVNPITAP